MVSLLKGKGKKKPPYQKLTNGVGSGSSQETLLHSSLENGDGGKDKKRKKKKKKLKNKTPSVEPLTTATTIAAKDAAEENGKKKPKLALKKKKVKCDKLLLNMLKKKKKLKKKAVNGFSELETSGSEVAADPDSSLPEENGVDDDDNDDNDIVEVNVKPPKKKKKLMGMKSKKSVVSNDKVPLLQSLSPKKSEPRSQPAKMNGFAPPTVPDLPITECREAFIQRFWESDTLIVVGETGCGKSTQIPQYLFKDCPKLFNYRGMAVTQPRRVAAISLATRVSYELGTELGALVGFKVRFDKQVTDETKITFVTDGYLMMDAIRDKYFKQYSVIIVDEAHERSVETDVVLSLLRNAQIHRKNLNPKKRLKLIIMSATLDVDKFKTFYDGDKYGLTTKAVFVKGRPYSLQLNYLPRDVPENHIDLTWITLLKLHLELPANHHILVFLTGKEEIDLLVARATAINQQKDMTKVYVCPLYAALSKEVQMKAFELPAENMRKIVVSTNIAETSLTIPGIRVVIDSGRVKSKYFEETLGMNVLHVQLISKSQADQRAGRAGRECEGSVYRLYTKSNYESMEDFPLPEITRSNLSRILLLAAVSLGISNFKDFPLPDPPTNKCDPGSGVDAFFHALHAKNDSKIVSLLGTACSEVTERLAKVATHQRIIQVSFGSTSPSLSDKKEFPLFYRTVAPVSSHSEAIIELIRHFQWDTVTFFTKNENRYTMPANFLVSELEKTNVTCKATLTFSTSDYQDQLQEMKELDSRIIIANFGSDVAPLVFCEIYRMGMYGSDYAWILIGEPETDWWQESPSPSSTQSSGSRTSTAAKTKRGGSRKRPKRNSKLAAETLNMYSTTPASTLYSRDSPHFSQATSSSGRKAHQFRRSRLGLEEPLPYDSETDDDDDDDDDADSISIRMATRKAVPANRVSISTPSSPSVRSGFSTNTNRKSSGESSSPFPGAIRKLNSSSNPGTLRLKSSGKSLHQKEQQQNRHHHQSDCSSKQLMEAVRYAIVVDRYNILEQPSDSGMTTEKFRDRLLQRSRKAYNTSADLVGSQFAPETYDAVWTVALGLQRVQTKYNYNFQEFTRKNESFTQLLKREIGSLNFSGISGPITFSGSDRIGITSFMQIQDGDLVQVGLLFPDRPTNKLELSCKGCGKIRWHGNQVPISRREFRFKRIRVEYSLYIIVATAASLGIVLAATFLAFNLYHRKLKYIKLSSPKLNNIVIIGCMFAYLAVILLGTDFTTVPDGNQFAYICIIRAYLLSMAFSMAFGAMFAKTYRVYRIFTRSCIGVVKNKLLRDTQLMTLIMVLVFIDCIVVSSWALFDPMQVNLRNLTLQIDPSDRTVVYQPQIEVCRSQHVHVWLSALYGYKSLLLVVGLYMAWETRFIVEDTKELLFRAEVQNRVYKRQIDAIDAEIWRLENLLTYSPSKNPQTGGGSSAADGTVKGGNKPHRSFVPLGSYIKDPFSRALDIFFGRLGLLLTCKTPVEAIAENSYMQYVFANPEHGNKDTLLKYIHSAFSSYNLLHTRTDSNSDSDSEEEEEEVFVHAEKRKRKSGEDADASGLGGEEGDEDSSSDEDDSTSEIYTVYLHGPRFIVPISLFNFKNSNAINPSTLTSGICGDSRNQKSGALSTPPSSAPRSSWPNSRYLAIPANGLINAKKYCFKSEPRLQVEPCGEREEGEPESRRKGISIISRARAGRSNSKPSTAIHPPTIIQWGDDDDMGYTMEEGEMVGISGVSSAGSSTTSCNNLNLGKAPSSRKGSSVSGTASKRSSIFSAFKNPWSYLTGIIKQPATSGSSSESRKESIVNYYYPMEMGELGTGPSGGGQQDNYLLKPIAYFGGQSKSSASSSQQQRQKFSSVPDLWAVRGSPDLDPNHYSHKKYSVNSDTAAVGGNGINPASSSTEFVGDNPDPDPVLKLIVTSHESVYL